VLRKTPLDELKYMMNKEHFEFSYNGELAVDGPEGLARVSPSKASDSMDIVTTTAELEALCAALSHDSFIAVDTEFMREQTYWPVLCLIQVAGGERQAIIDPQAPGLDLTTFFELMANPRVLKVFHAARQDIEIMVYRSGVVPAPVFDTQVAAMVCGFGDQVGYEQIVRKLAKAQIDKSSRFTDWSRRPLSERQLAYALSDVTHLRTVYEQLREKLERTGREPWLTEEMAILTSLDTYTVTPKDAWKRLKVRLRSKKQFAVLVAVAEWREHEAREKNVPRARILKDDAIAEVAIQMPQTKEALAALRVLPRGFGGSRNGEALLKAVKRAARSFPKALRRPRKCSSLRSRSSASEVALPPSSWRARPISRRWRSTMRPTCPSSMAGGESCSVIWPSPSSRAAPSSVSSKGGRPSLMSMRLPCRPQPSDHAISSDAARPIWPARTASRFSTRSPRRSANRRGTLSTRLLPVPRVSEIFGSMPGMAAVRI
jgi:ribonuclease D